jgi:hypothetical protein
MEAGRDLADRIQVHGIREKVGQSVFAGGAAFFEVAAFVVF